MYTILGEPLSRFWERVGDTDRINEELEARNDDMERDFAERLKGLQCVGFLFDDDTFVINSPDRRGEYIDCMAIKEGIDWVMFDDGTFGYVGYYGRHVDHVKIITDMDRIMELADENQLEELEGRTA